MSNNAPMNREGFALPVALLAMIVIGALVTGGFYVSGQEAMISSSSDLATQAFYVAESGLDEAIAARTNADLEDLRICGSATAPTDVSTGSITAGSQTLGNYQVTIRPLGDLCDANAGLYMVMAEGTSTAGPRSATRTVGSVFRTTRLTLPQQSALTVFGGLNAQGNSQVRGQDDAAVPNGMSCPGRQDRPGVTAKDSSLVDEGNKDRITGDPDVNIVSTLDTAGLSDFGPAHLNDLINRASITYSAGDSENGMGPVVTQDANGNDVCDTSVKSNWGEAGDATDPNYTPGPCANYMPIIHAEGDLHLKTGSGQGILIVEGDLTASGNFDFYGIVVVKGTLKTTGTGNHFEGTVLVQGSGELDSESTTNGNSLVQYSSCRVDNVLKTTLSPQRLGSRSWIDFTTLTRGET